MKYNNFIGVFDSGAGGLTVLSQIEKVLPNENIVYYGDTKHCPYGDKTPEEILNYSLTAIDYLINNGVKAVVVACNTATSAAISKIRKKYKDKIIIGIEPALKPAVTKHKNKRIIVMATSSTIKLEKYKELENLYKKDAEIISIACPGLADAIENNKGVDSLLHQYLDAYNNVSAVVLGCTHFPLIKDNITNIVGDVEFFDGSIGVAHNLKETLTKNNLLASKNNKSKKVFISSDDTKDYGKLYKQLFQKE